MVVSCGGGKKKQNNIYPLGLLKDTFDKIPTLMPLKLGLRYYRQNKEEIYQEINIFF